MNKDKFLNKRKTLVTDTKIKISNMFQMIAPIVVMKEES